MKLYVKCSDDLWSMNYTPRDISEDVDDIISQLKDAIENKFKRRYKHIGVDIDDVSWGRHSLEADVILYNNGKVIRDRRFVFDAYNSYFDESDYIQHINTTIDEFVSNLSNR